MATRIDSPLLVRWSRALSAAGIDTTTLLAESEEQDAFGNAEASFGWGGLVLHLVRERGQEFVDVAPAHNPLYRFRLDDIGLALGWRNVEEIMARTEPIPLADELAELARHRTELESALSVQHLAATRVAIDRAVAQRERAFLDKLRKLADQSR
jgi:hypothetical protein